MTSARTEHPTTLPARFYGGLWKLIVRWMRVPQSPPTLPASPGTAVESFRPAPAFLRYLRFWFWFALLAVVPWILGWIAVTIVLWWVGLILLPLLLIFVVLPYLMSYVAMYLRFDSTWYVLTDRSMRIRRGMWTIEETTITFENVQDVRVMQGPLQRYLGIADVVVRTAGGGSGGGGHHGGGGMHGGHVGLIEGIADAPRVRDLILSRLKRSPHAGLGDEAHHAVAAPAWTPAHLQELRSIRDAFARLVPA